MTLIDFLKRHAQLSPDKPAVVCREEVTTYARLWQQVQRRADQLLAAGATPGMPYAFRASQDADFLVTYFAAHLVGAPAMPLERDMPESNMQSLLQRIDGSRLPAHIADVLFTTGTTGQSNGVLISHDTLIAEAENLAEAQGFSADTVFVICGPFNHLGSLSKIFPVVMLGGTLLVTEGVKDQEAFFRAMEYPSRHLATFLVPAAIRLLLQFGRERLAACADKIEFIETGAAAIAQSDMEELCRLLPHTRLYNTYASTETGIISTFNFNAGECRAGCLGAPMKHSAFYITDEGKVACRGRTIMQGYLGDDELTRRVLRDETILTADCGYIDNHGRLHLKGRADDIINLGGYKVNPAEVEDVALGHPAVADCICIPYTHPVLGVMLKLLVKVMPATTLDRREMAKYLAERLERYKVPQSIDIVDTVERTYNGKLNRKHYLQ